MSAVEYKQKIKDAIESFSSGELRDRALNFFEVLGYNTSRSSQFEDKTYSEFKDLYVNEKFNEDKAIVKDWGYVDILFQVSKDEVTDERGLFDTGKVNDTIIESYLFFTIELKGDGYSRTQLSNISREVNKLFPMPVMILFKYNGQVTLSIINRRINKKDGSRDVLEKVTQIKDINISNPHRAHVEILHDLSFTELQKDFKITNFVELHNAWQKTLDTKELNKRFYQELSNWYFWAMDYAKFPADVEKDENIRNATNLIRLITRIIFIWFIKEKGFVPDKIFNRNEAVKIVKDFCKNNKSHYYYNAILQNLFFGTLNQNMKERKFAIETEDYVKRDHGVKNLYRYKDMFLIPEKQVLALFADVPFLNGGLFDCLDKDETETEKQSHQYIDGFSRNDKKRAILPDFLFFADEDEYDLNEIFGTRNKKYKVRGLIEILSSYKFTITENTPIEEEIALDPELLGKVFENLLASYNPETSTTARKQTGSFYTPREIVNYMVDESLIAYLEQKMKDAGYIDSEDKIRDLISYSEEIHKFDKKQTAVLICAIDNCKILDPACGSGAFPMGILHKLVHVLHKLDPKNEQWKQRQIDKVNAIDDASIREHSIEDIENAFEHNELDYGRKLYLIENCIYGVDIQPIAVQIAKLRFFISLIIDQKRDDKKDNHGIRSLPNLETKFVAANTLIGLEKHVEVDINDEAQGLLIGNDLKSLESELKELRHKYFTAKTRKEKLACQKEDKKLREKISKSLISDGWDAASAKQLVAFDPYDQNASSPFFEPEWMFGVVDGFDVVIGNPPYVRVQNMRSDEKLYFNKNYQSAIGNFDLYVLFLEKGFMLLKNNGVTTFIHPNKFFVSNYGVGLRKFLINNNALMKVLDFRANQVFETATTYTCISFFSKKINLLIDYYSFKENISFIDVVTFLTSDYWNKFRQLSADSLSEQPWLFSNEQDEEMITKLSKLGNTLEEISLNISQGFKTGADKIFINDDFSNIEKKILVKVLKGEDIQRYIICYNDKKSIFPYKQGKNSISPLSENELKIYTNTFNYLKQFKKQLLERDNGKIENSSWFLFSRNQFINLVNKPKIITRDISQRPSFAFDSNGEYGLMGGYGITLKQGYDYKYVLAVLNSNVSFYHISKISVLFRGAYFSYESRFIKQLIIPTVNNDIQKKIAAMTDFVQELKINSSDCAFFESLIDAMVYELYFPEEIKAANAEVLKHLNNLTELKDDWSDYKKLKTIEKVYKELSDPAHPVSVAMQRQKSVEEVRIIEGL